MRGFGSTFGSGTTDAISLSYQATHTLNTWSIFANRNGSGGGGFGRLFDKDHAGVGSRTFFADTANSLYTLQIGWTGSANLCAQWTIPIPSSGVLHHLLITYDGSSTANDPVIYLNNVSQTVTEVTTPVGTLGTSATPYILGNKADGLRNWDGILAQFSHWDRILSAQERAAIFNKFSSWLHLRGLVQYYELTGRYSPEPSHALVDGSGTVTGTGTIGAYFGIKTTATDIGKTFGIAVTGVVESLRTTTTDPMTWSMNVGVTAPDGILVAFMHGTSSTDHVVAVTYGGVAMARVQRNVDTATEPGAAEWWWLGEGAVPPGTQTVSADLASATTDDIHGVCIALKCNEGQLVVLDVDGISDTNAANPSVTLQYGGFNGMAFAAFYSGLTAHSSITPPANCLKITTQELAGNFTSCILRQMVASTADFAIGATAAADDVAYATVAVGVLTTRVVGKITQPIGGPRGAGQRYGAFARAGINILEADGESVGTAVVAAQSGAIAGVIAAAAGTATCTAVGAGLGDGVGASVGVGTVTGVGAAVTDAIASAAGTATVLGEAEVATVAVDANAAGVATVTGVGAMVAAGVGASVGSSTGNAPSGAVAASVGSAAGVATVLGVREAGPITQPQAADITGRRYGDFARTGQPTRPDVGPITQPVTGPRGPGRRYGDFDRAPGTIVEADGASVGSATCTAVGAAFFAGVGASVGTATVAGLAATVTDAVGASAGAAVCAAISETVVAGVGSAAGVSTVTGLTTSITEGFGSSVSIAIVSGISEGAAESVAASSGTATVLGISGVIIAADGNAAGTSTCTAAGARVRDGVGLAAGTVTVLGEGRAVWQANGLSAGVGTGTGLANYYVSGVGLSVGFAGVFALGEDAGTGPPGPSGAVYYRPTWRPRRR